MNKYLAQFLSHNNLINIGDTASQKALCLNRLLEA